MSTGRTVSASRFSGLALAVAGLAALFAARRAIKGTDTAARMGTRLPVLSGRDTARLFAGVLLPTVAKGPILRRPWIVALAERMDLDGLAVRTIQELAGRYERGPLLVGPILGRRWALVTEPQDVARVLRETPEPFAAAAAEKRAALAHFQPRGVLVSHGEARTARREINDRALESGRPLHRLAEVFTRVVDEEARRVVAAVSQDRPFTWDDFLPA